MGMFDDVKHAEGLYCGEGKHLLHDFQTKDLECGMNSYHIVDGRLFLESGKTKESYEAGPDVVRKTSLISANRAGSSFDIYAYCEECTPIVFMNNSTFGGPTTDRSPSVEYGLTLDANGSIVREDKLKVQSRQDVINELKSQGQDVIDQNGKLALRHLILKGYDI